MTHSLRGLVFLVLSILALVVGIRYLQTDSPATGWYLIGAGGGYLAASLTSRALDWRRNNRHEQ